MCALTGATFNQAKLGEPVTMKWILTHDGFDLLAALAQRHDDAAIARNLSARHQEMPGRIVLVQERDVLSHVTVDLCELANVCQFDDEHALNLAAASGPCDGEAGAIVLGWAYPPPLASLTELQLPAHAS